jgi:hypothetical protein
VTLLHLRDIASRLDRDFDRQRCSTRATALAEVARPTSSSATVIS